MGGSVMSRLIIVGAGLLYPAYSSYKAVKGANVRLYVRWIMYWVVFALFTAIEMFTDLLISWLPFYYELKIIFVFWLVLPYSKGSTIIYRKFIHPNLSRREEEIDLFLENAREKSYQTVVSVGSKGINLAANAVVHAAVKSQTVVSNKLKSYSVMDLTSIPEHTEVHRQTTVPLINPPVARERHMMTSNPTMTFSPATQTDGATSQFTSQYKALSMINLNPECSEELEAETKGMLGDDDFSSEPPTHTTDDMQITRRSNYAEESVPSPEEFTTQFYPTMPRPRKGGKAKTKQMPPLPQVDTTMRQRKSESKPQMKYELQLE